MSPPEPGASSGWRRTGVLARRLEALLVPLVVVLGAAGIAFPAPARSIDRAGAVDPTLAVLVLTAGLAVGTGALGQARGLRGRLVVVLAVSTAVLPVLAWAVGHLASGPARGGILAVGVAPSEVASLGLTAMAGGEAATAAVLVVGSSVLTVLTSGALLAALSGAASVRTSGLLATLGLVVGLPLVAGRTLSLLGAGRTALLDAGRILGVVALLLLLWEVAGEVQLRASYLWVVAALVGFLAGASALGWLLARGLAASARPAVLLSVAMRDFAVAAGIAAAAFGPKAVGPLGIYGLLVLAGGAVTARLIARSRRPGRPAGRWAVPIERT